MNHLVSRAALRSFFIAFFSSVTPSAKNDAPAELVMTVGLA
jgi:hypothetical protein